MAWLELSTLDSRVRTCIHMEEDRSQATRNNSRHFLTHKVVHHSSKYHRLHPELFHLRTIHSSNKAPLSRLTSLSNHSQQEVNKVEVMARAHTIRNKRISKRNANLVFTNVHTLSPHTHTHI